LTQPFLSFSHTHTNTHTHTLYLTLMLTCSLAPSLLAGYNVCIFAYGQTGSGKTHTMSGTNVERMEGRGINYRALDDLFAMVEERSGEVSGHKYTHARTYTIIVLLSLSSSAFIRSLPLLPLSHHSSSLSPPLPSLRWSTPSRSRC
jgi:hypothetical protein